MICAVVIAVLSALIVGALIAGATLLVVEPWAALRVAAHAAVGAFCGSLAMSGWLHWRSRRF